MSHISIPFLLAATVVIGVGLCAHQRALWGLYAVMASVPLSYRSTFQNTPLYFLAELALIPFSAIVFFRRRDLFATLKESPFLTFLPFLSFIALSVLWAENQAAVVKEVIRWGEFILLGCAAVFVIDRKTGFDKVPAFLGWIGVVVSLIGIVQFLEGTYQAKFRPGAAFLGHPNPTAAFISLCFLPVLGLLIQERQNQLLKRLLMFSTLLLGLAFTFSRGVILACIVGTAFFLFDETRSHLLRTRRVKAVLLGVLVALAALTVIPRFRHTAFNRLITHSSLGERQYIFALGWSVFKQHPLLGLGAGNMKHYAAKQDLEVRKGEPFASKYGDLHNFYLELAVETGLIGLILFLGGLIGFTYRIIQQNHVSDPMTEPLFRSLWAVSLTYLLANATGFYTIKGIHLEWAVLLALLFVMARNKDLAHA